MESVFVRDLKCGVVSLYSVVCRRIRAVATSKDAARALPRNACKRWLLAQVCQGVPVRSWCP